MFYTMPVWDFYMESVSLVSKEGEYHFQVIPVRNFLAEELLSFAGRLSDHCFDVIFLVSVA
jgi:hypothetical protein